MVEPYDLVVVGAGLSALAFLKQQEVPGGDGRTLVVDYRPTTGGFLGAALPAEEFPEESAILGAFQPSASVEIRLSTTAVGLAPGAPGTPHTVLLRGTAGASQEATRRVMIATGSLEMPREHDAIPGMRPAGVVTPVFIHQILAQGYLPGRRAIVYGEGQAATLIARRLAAAGADVTLVPPSGAITPAADTGIRTLPPASITAVAGQARLERVTLRRGERTEEIAADTLVYATGALPNTLWLKGSGIELNRDGTIRTDECFRTSIPEVFAIGTVIRPSLDHDRSVAMGREAARALGGER
jgi:pyruvate/2-oxoglutarate dehydrogenase complex dihydrolipoamide dehydrogenase (E3) component